MSVMAMIDKRELYGDSTIFFSHGVFVSAHVHVDRLEVEGE